MNMFSDETIKALRRKGEQNLCRLVQARADSGLKERDRRAMRRIHETYKNLCALAKAMLANHRRQVFDLLDRETNPYMHGGGEG